MDAFRKSVRFAPHVQAGKQAIKGEHRDMLVESSGARLTASLDFERAMADDDLQHKRFDYFFATERLPARCHALEVHAYKPSELVAKKRGTVELLKRHCPEALGDIASWNVLVKGAMPRQDMAARFQADNRIQMAGRILSTAKL